MAKRPSKSEARLARQNAKLLKNSAKSVRLSSTVDIKDKFIRATVTPDLTKAARSAVSVHNYKDCYLTWCNSHSDLDGEWSWSEPRGWSEDEFKSDIKPHFDSFTSVPWSEVESATYNGADKIRKALNKYQPLDSLCDEAQIRWWDLELVSEFEDLFRFRLGSNKRAWGIRIQHHFYLVWYERNHQICPIDN